MRIYNTLSRQIEPFESLETGKVGLYCCGPTVYNFAHIGNMRCYLFEDLLRRTLEVFGYTVNHVMNITDVGHLTSDADEGEDKMIMAMRREGKTAHDIARFYADAFFRHAQALNIKRANTDCWATEHIAEMIALIQRLEHLGYAYLANGNVYFDIRALDDYGKLNPQSIDDLQVGSRIEVDSAKRDPRDFALWFTKSKYENHEMIWDSPWGLGYPGWHIECSAMSMKYLGEQFDIHCGGIDHVPVHHTNEIAQSEAVTGKRPWVRYWMHSEWLVADKEKMSKSKGGFLTVDTLINKGYDPLAFRYLCLGAHYRQQLAFSFEALDSAATALDRLRGQIISFRKETEPAVLEAEHPLRQEFLSQMADDLNAPRALAILWKTLRDDALPGGEKLALIYDFDEVLGLDLRNYMPAVENIPEEVQSLALQRADARIAKNWAEADRFRQEITARGYTVKDTPSGPILSRINQ